jgi:hypothetical protein
MLSRGASIGERQTEVTEGMEKAITAEPKSYYRGAAKFTEKYLVSFVCFVTLL